MNDSALLIIVGIIGVAIGFALGVVVAGMRSGREEKPASEIERIEQVAEPPSVAPKSVAAPPPLVTPISTPAEIPSTPVQRPSISPVDVIARALQPDKSALQPPPKSIAGQIDEILQEMLENSDIAVKAVRLMELPNKGMVVMVGLKQYEGVDAVPDDEIKNIIRSAVAEWERRVAE
jgi:hypothetical protein